MASVSPGAHFSWSSSLFHASVQRICLFHFHRFGLLLEKIDGRSMKVLPPDSPRLFLRCPYEVEGQSMSLMTATFEDSMRSTESRAFSLLFLGMRCLSSLSIAYGNIMLVILATFDVCVLAIEILPFVVGSRCSPWFRRLCSFVGEVTVISIGSKIL
ncbi:hypothetical protein V6N12_070194 [Hibiscus sabdariffa]|uniref:Uncharacterized protein n=1 Tax=Hibiscus sabdariffa TaxID=183260 RepID=A0ABR2FGK1_9ROSI